MNVQHLPFELERAGDRTLHGDWHVPLDQVAQGTVLFLHGYKGYKDWGAWNMVGDIFARQGWRFLRINFTHNGTSFDHPNEFVDLEAFSLNTHRRELDETLAVIQALRSKGTVDSHETLQGPLAIIGHSRGGGVACLAAAEWNEVHGRTGLEPVSHLVTWASVDDFQSRFPKGESLAQWEASNRLEVINHRTRQRLHHQWGFYSDFQDHQVRLNVRRAVEQFRGPSLVAHCKDDPAVDVKHALRLAEWSQDPTLFIMDEGGHTFGSCEPWEKAELPSVLMAMTQTTLHFLEEGRAAE